MADVERQKRISNGILNAINTVVNTAIERLDRDKTVMATIISCTNALTGEYKVSYGGGMILAYSRSENETYRTNDLVWLQIPQGDLSNTKFILGKASRDEAINNLSFITSALDGYNRIGTNLVGDSTEQLPYGLHSYLAQDGRYLYYFVENREDPDSDFIKAIKEQTFLSFNQTEFRDYIENAEALLVQGSFKTRLPKAHRQNKNGIYGLIFTLAFKSQNASAVKDDGTAKTIDDYTSNEIVYRDYVINSNNMLGNPFLYESFTEQYGVYDIDATNFLFLKSIRIYSNGFEEQDNTVQDNLWGADIFIDSPQIYGLQKISAQNSDYIMKVGMPQGATFYTLLSTETKRVEARTTYLLSDISDSTTYYWFAQDDRVSIASEDYQVYGGAGWKYLRDKGNNYNITLSGAENQAKSNTYMVVGVYKQQIVLKQEFMMFNQAQSRKIDIISNLGTKFSFDRGFPTLTCTIDGKASDFDDFYEDDDYVFAWSKTDNYGNVFIFDRTYEEIQEQLAQVWAEDPVNYSKAYSLENDLAAMENVELDNNILKYPMNKVLNYAIFRCSVYIKATEGTYKVGQASIILENSTTVNNSNYTVVIDGGNQVFQYDEFGTSPASDKYSVPQEITPLSVRMYDVAGQEVNPDTYTINWILPDEEKESTLLDLTNIQDLIVTSPSGRKEYNAQIFPLAIKTYYDYSAIANQLTAEINYNGEYISKNTDFLFTKIGNNGTNGTDITCYIEPKGDTNGNLPTIDMINFAQPKWNFVINNSSTSQFAQEALDLRIFQRSEELQPHAVSWSIMGSTYSSKYYKIIDSDKSIIDVQKHENGKYTNLIVRARDRREDGYYYAYLGIPLINYHGDVGYELSFNKQKNLQSIVYSPAGTNPAYNKNQGLQISLSNPQQQKVILQVVGGEGEKNGDSSTADFRLIPYKDAGSSMAVTTTPIGVVSDAGKLMVYILPNDRYSGEWTNNVIYGQIYNANTAISPSAEPEVEFWYPIQMMLNTYPLKSINDWDGNHIEINEDEDYILAPQIGAGQKENDNTFTGLVMGVSRSYTDESTTQIGLLGYSRGKQSIFLNSEDGSALFGLPESEGDTEGQIYLKPYGKSSIGAWTFEANSLFNIRNNENDTNVDTLGPAYSDTNARKHKKDIPGDSYGVHLNANPGYMTFKTKPLRKTDPSSGINWDQTVLNDGDSLEIQIDPNQRSIFTLFRVYENDAEEIERYPLVGIDNTGRFYSNALRNQGAGLSIGPLGAFGIPASSGYYTGGVVQTIDENYPDRVYFLFKMFTQTGDTGSNHLYLSGGTESNEYIRSMSMHFQEITLDAYSSGDSYTSTITSNRLGSSNNLGTATSTTVLGARGAGFYSNVAFASPYGYFNNLYLGGDAVATQLYVDNACSNLWSNAVNTFATPSGVNSAINAALSYYATKSYVDTAVGSIDLSGYAKTTDLSSYAKINSSNTGSITFTQNVVAADFYKNGRVSNANELIAKGETWEGAVSQNAYVDISGYGRYYFRDSLWSESNLKNTVKKWISSDAWVG